MNDYQPKGLFVYQNDKGQYVYSDLFTTGGYVISRSDYKKYQVYALRYILGVAIVALLSMLIDWKPAIIVGVLTVLVGEVLFRVKFLGKTCSYDPRFKKPEANSFLDKITKSTDPSKKIIKAILFVAFGILIVINGYQQNYTGFFMILSWAVGVLSEIFAVLFFISFIKDGGLK